MNKQYIAYLNSREWAEIRNDLYSIRGRKCERCGSKKNIQIHHKTYKNIFHEEPEDLEILCGRCHKKEHKIKKRKKLKQKKKRKPNFNLSKKDKRIQGIRDRLKNEGYIVN